MSTTPRQAPPLFSLEPAPRGRNLTALWLVALGVICAVALTLQIHHFWPFMTDDAYISLRYSQRLLEGHGLTWNNLPPAVEGYTNFLWVLLCAGLGALGMNLETAAHLLGITTTAAGIVAVAAQVYRDYPAKVKFFSALYGSLALCLSAPVAVWALGGLEQPLLAALLAWAAYFGIRWVSSSKGQSRDADLMGILLGLAVLSRADAALFTVLFYAGAVLADGVRPRSLIARARLLPLPILFFAAQEIFRYTYYGAWWPNTAYVKVAFTLHRLYTGLRYDVYGTGSEIVFLLLAVVGAVALCIAGKKQQVIFLATISIGWLLYILIIGGDIFPSYRHFVPAMALMGFLVAGCGLLTLAAPFRFSVARVTIFLLLTLLVLTSDLFAPLETWEGQGKEIGLFLRTAFGAKHPLLVSDAAGVVPYYSQMEAIDPLGLNDYHIARHPVANRGKGWVGHELGDGKYVLDHNPDILLLANFQSDALFDADRQLLADPRFASHYQLIHIDAGPPNPIHAGLYIRRINGKLGIQNSGDRVTVPAYLAKVDNANSVRLIDGKAQLVIAPHGSAQFLAIPLAPGSWNVTLDGAGAARLRVQATEASRACASCVQAGANGSAAVTIENTTDQPAALANLQLTPAADSGSTKPVPAKKSSRPA
jgi:arabinofuranosyltransferase